VDDFGRPCFRVTKAPNWWEIPARMFMPVDVAACSGGSNSPKTPVGKSGNPMDVPKGTNDGGIVNGIEYKKHAFDQMQSRGITPSVVENTIKNGTATPGKNPGTTAYYDKTNNVTVITNSNGAVITTSFGEIKQ